jgi:hypothetical protein
MTTRNDRIAKRLAARVDAIGVHATAVLAVGNMPRQQAEITAIALRGLGHAEAADAFEGLMRKASTLQANSMPYPTHYHPRRSRG